MALFGALRRAVQLAYELEEEYLIDRRHLCLHPDEVFMDGNGDVRFALQGSLEGHLGCLVGRMLGADMPAARPLPEDRPDWLALIGDVQRARERRHRIVCAKEPAPDPDPGPDADAPNKRLLDVLPRLAKGLREPRQVYRLWALCFVAGILYALVT